MGNTVHPEPEARIRAEYLEMPGMALSRRQIQRLWSLDPGTCDTVVSRLVDMGFLRERSDRTYVRRTNAA
jgi:hypothetical protein